MAKNPKQKEMRQVELIIGQILRIGVVISAVVLVIGMVALFIQGSGGYPNGTEPTSFHAIWMGLLAGKSYAIIMLGLFLLILTPTLRVVVSIYAFAVEGDRLYVWITTIVLIILVIASVIGYLGS